MNLVKEYKIVVVGGGGVGKVCYLAHGVVLALPIQYG